MKHWKRLICFLISLAALSGIAANVVMAQTVSQSGLEVTIIPDKESYDEEEAIESTLQVSNVSDREVTNIRLNHAIPEGYVLSEDSQSSLEQERLAPGETITLKVKLEPSASTDDPANKNPGTPGGSDNSNNNSNNNSNSNNNNNGSGVTNTGYHGGTTRKTGTKAGKGSDQKTAARTAVTFWTLSALFAASAAAVLLIRKKKLRSFFSLVLAASMASSLLSVSPAKVSAEEPEGRISVEQVVSAGDKNVSLKGTVTFKPTKDDDTPDLREVSRGDWIRRLCMQLNIPAADLDAANSSFIDISDNEYAPYIEAAVQSGILSDIENDVWFHPEEAADREFAALTVIRGAGFASADYSEDFCSDFEELTYPQEVFSAIETGLLSLEDGAFHPAKALTEDDALSVLTKISEINQSGQPDHTDDVFEYAQGVLVDELNGLSYTLTDNGDGTWTLILPVTPDTLTIHTGTGMILPDQNGEGPTAVVAASEPVNNGSTLTLIVRAPEDPSEVLESMKYQETITDFSQTQVEVLDPDVEVMTSESSSTARRARSTFAVPLNLKLDLGKKKFSEKSSLKGSVTITIPSVTLACDVDFNWLNTKVNELSVILEPKIAFDGGLEYKLKPTESPTKYFDEIKKEQVKQEIYQLVRIPLPTAIPAVKAEMVVGLAISGKGELKVHAEVQPKVGVQILNNRFRDLGQADGDIQLLSAGVEGKAGVALGPVLSLFNTIDMIGFDLQAGPALDFKLANLHTSPWMVCSDLSLYLYSSWEMYPDTFIANFLERYHTSVSGKIWTSSNSPLKTPKLHAENFTFVDECTYGKGTIKGHVVSATDGSPIKDAKIAVYRYDHKIKTCYTDDNGNFETEQLGTGEYVLKASAKDYQTFDIESVMVQKGKQTDAGEIRMIPGTSSQDDEKQTVRGRIINAYTAQLIDDSELTVAKGLNRSLENLGQSDIVETKNCADGSYELTLDKGNYTIICKKDGYVNGYVNVTVLDDAVDAEDIQMIPGDDSHPDKMVIILTWGENPSDLDSHLFARNEDGSLIDHIFFGHKWHTSEQCKLDLDRDDTTSYGPETTTILETQPDVDYSFYVKDYTNGSSSKSTALSESGAKVRIFKAGKLLMSFQAPTSKQGTIWHVFDYDAGSGDITPHGDMYSSFSQTPDRSRSRTTSVMSNVEQEIRMISEGRKDGIEAADDSQDDAADRNVDSSNDVDVAETDTETDTETDVQEDIEKDSGPDEADSDNGQETGGDFPNPDEEAVEPSEDISDDGVTGESESSDS